MPLGTAIRLDALTLRLVSTHSYAMDVPAAWGGVDYLHDLLISRCWKVTNGTDHSKLSACHGLTRTRTRKTSHPGYHRPSAAHGCELSPAMFDFLLVSVNINAKMRGSDQFRDTRSAWCSWRRFVVLLAIFAISLSVATRTFRGPDLGHASFQSAPSHAFRQHLAADAIEVTKPVSQIVGMLLPVASPHGPPAEPDNRLIEFFSESLYNRPPPSVSLL